MLTFFTVPKPFEGHIALIQRNAIGSWLRLRPACEILLIGQEKGIAETAREFGLCHLPDIDRNDYGTPLLNSIFERASSAARNSVLCYVNTDIILMSDFIQAAEQVLQHKEPFLMVGQRWDVDLADALDFRPGWEESLRSYVTANGRLHPQTGIDYFMFPKGIWGSIPPFAVGRPAWDNWMIYRARANRTAVIDATEMIMAVHQNHGWAHIEGGEQAVLKGPEAILNRNLAGGRDRIFTLLDADWILNEHGLQKTQDPRYAYRAWDTWLVLHPRLYTVLERLRLIPHWRRILSALRRLIFSLRRQKT